MCCKTRDVMTRGTARAIFVSTSFTNLETLWHSAAGHISAVMPPFADTY